MRIWSADVRSYLTLALFILLVLGGGTLIGLMTLPGEWYAELAKPPFNPPNWIFAPVWTLLYIMVAVAGWRTWQRGPRSAAMALWFVQLALNFVWSP
ncbi:MAG: TspO/MBR family protein, partial [Pseudolabrys sp.]